MTYNYILVWFNRVVHNRLNVGGTRAQRKAGESMLLPFTMRIESTTKWNAFMRATRDMVDRVFAASMPRIHCA
jgi:hypothetical protein